MLLEVMLPMAASAVLSCKAANVDAKVSGSNVPVGRQVWCVRVCVNAVHACV